MQLGAAPVNPEARMTKGAQKSARFGSKFWGKPAGGNRNLWTNWREQRKGEPKASLQFIQLQHFADYYCTSKTELSASIRTDTGPQRQSRTKIIAFQNYLLWLVSQVTEHFLQNYTFQLFQLNHTLLAKFQRQQLPPGLI